MRLRVILAVSSEARFRRILCAGFSPDVEVMCADRSDLLTHTVHEHPDVVIVEESVLEAPCEAVLRLICGLPDAPMVILLSEDTGEERRANLRAIGCEAVLSGRLSEEVLSGTLSAVVGRREMRQRELLRRRHTLNEPRLSDFVSRSPAMQAFMDVVRRVVRANSSLLLLGETGVGKERLALAIHAESKGNQAPFVAVNCAALPDALLESELFGHEAGAFTGAQQTRRGAFELADRGTIFLDEVGEMPLGLQSKFLRVLQEHRFQRVGGEKVISVDVRVIAATNRSLPDEVAARTFRRDLYYRLSVISLEIPPLRERREDIPELVASYIDYLALRVSVDVSSIHPDALTALAEYAWPGNVRELINVLERAMLLCDGDEICLRNLPEEIAGSVGPRRGQMATAEAETGASFQPTEEWFRQPWCTARKQVLHWYEEQYLRWNLAQSNGRTGIAAEAVGLTPRALQLNLKRLGIDRRFYT